MTAGPETSRASAAELREPEDEARRMLRDSVAGFARRDAPIARVRALRGTEPGYDRRIWGAMAEMGWLGVLVPEADGGLGLGFAEMAVVLEEMGRVAAPEPLCAAAVLASRCLVLGGDTALRAELLPKVTTGAVLPALAWQETAGTLDPAALETRLEESGNRLRLSGTKRFVAGAAGADGFLVSGRLGDGIGVAWIPADSPGLAISHAPQTDGGFLSTLRLEAVEVPPEHLVVEPPSGAAVLGRAIDEAMVMSCAEMSGIMAQSLDLTLDYMKTREQFGRPIGAFQALKHRAVDLFIARRIAAAVVAEAVALLDGEPAPGERGAMASRARARAAATCLRIVRESIQIHGAIGYTDEYDAGLFLNRALVLSAWLGNAAFHRRRFAALSPASAGAA